MGFQMHSSNAAIAGRAKSIHLKSASFKMIRVEQMVAEGVCILTIEACIKLIDQLVVLLHIASTLGTIEDAERAFI